MSRRGGPIKVPTMRLGVFGSWLFGLVVGACGSTPATATPIPSATETTVAAASSLVPTSLQCGVFDVFVERTATTVSVYKLVSPTGVSTLHFTWNSDRPPHPDFGTYICAQFRAGTPETVFVSLVAPGEPGYIARP
jgi:hypothetical protein